MKPDSLIAVYRSPGPHFGPPGLTFDCKGVPPEELDAAIAEGWSESYLQALGLEPKPVVEPVSDEPVDEPVPADDAPVTRAEMEQQAEKIGLKVDRRWSDETLMKRITLAMAGEGTNDA